MPKIKTRDVVKGTIKKIDKAAIAADRMRSAYVQTKEKAEHAAHPEEHSAEEYASDRIEGGVDRMTHEAAHQFDKQGRKGLAETKRNVSKAKDSIRQFKKERAAESLKRQFVRASGNKTIKAVEQTEKTVKQSARSAGKNTVKTVGKGTAKAAQKSVKTTKTAIKTTRQAAKTAQKTAQATVKATQKAAQAAKAAAKATAAGVKAAVKATVAAVKAIIAAAKALVAAIAAGGWVAVVVIIVICLIALICGSVFGIFFSGEDSGTGQSMRTAVQEINTEYDNRLLEIRNGTSYDTLEMSGSRAVWKEVLAVYSVKVNTDPDEPMEVATIRKARQHQSALQVNEAGLGVLQRQDLLVAAQTQDHAVLDGQSTYLRIGLVQCVDDAVVKDSIHRSCSFLLFIFHALAVCGMAFFTIRPSWITSLTWSLRRRTRMSSSGFPSTSSTSASLPDSSVPS